MNTFFQSTIPNAHKKQLVAAIVILTLSITLAHYTMSHTVIYLHDISRRLYYLPIILAGLWFGKKGGIYTAAAITILYFPHALFSWYGKNPRYLDNIIEIVFFNVVGYLIGSFIEKRISQQQKIERSARELKQAYRQLQTNSTRITELEEKMRFADRLSILGELSASLAHEVRNPLAGIQGAAEILKKKLSSRNDETEFIDIQLSEIQRLNKVVQNYLSLAKSETVNFTVLSINDIVRETIELVRLSARKKKIDIRIDLPDERIRVYGCILQIQQVILNLAINGIQAMENSGQLLLAVSSDKNRALLTVRDTGPGIPEENREKLFTAFFTSKKEGTGLGLSIVKRIVQNHNGKVWFETGATGTAFFVELALAEGE